MDNQRGVCEMINFIICLLFGHKKYVPKSIGKYFITITDSLGDKIVEVCLCKRCKLVYWEESNENML